jgi:hypothetical protein
MDIYARKQTRSDQTRQDKTRQYNSHTRPPSRQIMPSGIKKNSHPSFLPSALLCCAHHLLHAVFFPARDKPPSISHTRKQGISLCVSLFPLARLSQPSQASQVKQITEGVFHQKSTTPVMTCPSLTLEDKMLRPSKMKEYQQKTTVRMIRTMQPKP